MSDSIARVLYDQSSNQPIGVTIDGTNYLLMVSAKIKPGLPTPPAGATIVQVPADDPLDVGPSPTYRNTDYPIPDGKTLYIQQIIVGSQGDPTEAGSKVEVIYHDGSDDHLVQRIYVAGATVFVPFDDLSIARDQAVMVGGTGKYLRISRIRMSVSKQEIDAVLTGYLL